MFKHLCERYGKRKVYVVVSLILILLNILIVNLTNEFKISFTIEGQKFKYVSHTQDMLLFKDSKDNKVTVTIDNSVQGVPSIFLGAKYKIEYMDKLIKVDNSDWQNKGEVITLSDGSVFERELVEISAGNAYKSNIGLPFDIQLVNHINEVYSFVKEGKFSSILLLTVPFIFLGLAGIIYPEKIWSFQHMLVVSGGEPTGFALFSNRIAGIIFIGFSLLGPIIIANL